MEQEEHEKDIQSITVEALTLGDRRLQIHLRRTGKYSERFTTVFTQKVMEIARQGYGATYHNLCWWAIANLDGIEWRSFTAEEIAQHLNASPSAIRKWMPTVVADTVIELQKVGNRWRLRLHHSFAWTGRAEQREETKEEAEQTEEQQLDSEIRRLVSQLRQLGVDVAAPPKRG